MKLRLGNLLKRVVLAVLTVLALTRESSADTEPFNPDTFRYTGSDLGANYSAQSTALKLWAPTAKKVSVLLFDSPTSLSVSNIAMEHDSNGIWNAKIEGDMDGKYYLYETIFSDASGRESVFRVNDPYAHGSSANSGKTLIFDPLKTNPEDWGEDRFLNVSNNTDCILYEAHIRDFTIGTNSGATSTNRGKYLGMVEQVTKGPSGVTTGIDHLKELGISHVHLLPVEDYSSGDERQEADHYSWYDWGYGPVLYNNPEGSYASSADGTTRQNEMKRMIQGFHRQNIGVVMDVVYNHTASVGGNTFSIFDKIFPGYYYRKDAGGRYANGTYCGNEIASEKPMVRKFIVDSIKYWMKEYHVDGFRFDLMGILDRETMREVYREAKKINPSAIIYGEGWDMEHVLPPDRMMTQANSRGTGIAAFNDGIRDNLKGDVENASAGGFVQGAGPQFGGMNRLILNIKAQGTGRGGQSIGVHSPNESINYVSAHDDLCLWDKLAMSTPGVEERLRINMDKLAAGIILTAQGVPFIHAGDEFLRSKNRVKNSYNDNRPNVNPIDWSLKAKNAGVFAFYRGMILLRKSHPAFRMTTKAMVDAAVQFATNTPANVIEYVIKDHANGDEWKNILVIYNGTAQAQELSVAGEWTIVADEINAGTNALRSVKDGIPVEPFSLVVAHTESSFRLGK